MSKDGTSAWHDVDRALTELLGEMRIAQMGGQISLGFLLAVAYTSAIRSASEADRSLYSWAVGVTTSAVVLLLAPVPLHRVNFGQRARRRILVVGHVLALAGLVALAGAIVLTVWLAARIAVPGAAEPLVLWTAALVAGTWLVLPVAVRLRDDRERSLGNATASTSGAEPADRVGI